MIDLGFRISDFGFKRRGARQKIRNTKAIMILDLGFRIVDLKTDIPSVKSIVH